MSTRRDLEVAIALAQGCRLLMGACGDGLSALTEVLADQERPADEPLREDERAFVELTSTIRRQVSVFADQWLP